MCQQTLHYPSNVYLTFILHHYALFFISSIGMPITSHFITQRSDSQPFPILVSMRWKEGTRLCRSPKICCDLCHATRSRIHYWTCLCPVHASKQHWQVPSNISYKSCAYGLCHVLPSPWGNWSGTASNSVQVEPIFPVSQPCSMFNKLLYPPALPLSPGTLHVRGRRGVLNQMELNHDPC